MKRGFDVTMLAWPGWRGLLARRRWERRYGKAELERFQAFAEKRHAYWVAEGFSLSLAKN